MLYTPPNQKFRPLDRSVLGEVAKRIVLQCHEKTRPVGGGYLDCPIGKGGKVDDTSCIVGEVVEWTDAHGEAWAQIRRRKWFRDFWTCGGALPVAGNDELVMSSEQYDNGARVRNYPTNPNASFSTYWGSFSEYSGASFTSVASGWGRGGDRGMGMYGMRPEAAPRHRRSMEDDEDDEDEQ